MMIRSSSALYFSTSFFRRFTLWPPPAKWVMSPPFHSSPMPRTWKWNTTVCCHCRHHCQHHLHEVHHRCCCQPLSWRLTVTAVVISVLVVLIYATVHRWCCFWSHHVCWLQRYCSCTARPTITTSGHTHNTFCIAALPPEVHRHRRRSTITGGLPSEWRRWGTAAESLWWCWAVPFSVNIHKTPPTNRTTDDNVS